MRGWLVTEPSQVPSRIVKTPQKIDAVRLVYEARPAPVAYRQEFKNLDKIGFCLDIWQSPVALASGMLPR
jgi:hypothetical protein